MSEVLTHAIYASVDQEDLWVLLKKNVPTAIFVVPGAVQIYGLIGA
jgi:hypothetical protein